MGLPQHEVPVWLRVYTPSTEHEFPLAPPPSVLSTKLTLPELFERFYLPDMLKPNGADPKTIVSYRESLNWWKKLTGDPPLSDICRSHCTLFSSRLQEQKGRKNTLMAPHTVRKHCRQVSTILTWAGPAGEEDRDGQELLDRVPKIKCPKPPDLIPEGWTTEEINQLLAAAEGCTRPLLPGVKPSQWWRTIITVGYYEAWRLDTLLKLEYTWLRPDGSLKIQAQAVKRKEKETLVWPAAESLQAIEAIRTSRRLIFEWPYTVGWLQRHRRKLLKRAGLPPERCDWFGFHALRKASANELAEVNPLAAQYSLGHTNMKTTQNHYINPKIVRTAKAKMTKLENHFTPPTNDPQGKLFE